MTAYEQKQLLTRKVHLQWQKTINPCEGIPEITVYGLFTYYF